MMGEDDKFSGLLIRDLSIKSDDGVAILLNEAGRKKFNRDSIFIKCRDDQWKWFTRSFDSINVPSMFIHWYLIYNRTFSLKGYLMDVEEFVRMKKVEKENKKAAKLSRLQTSLFDTITPEVKKDSLEYQINTCRHKFNKLTQGDFQTCYECRMRKCLSCSNDFSDKKNAETIAVHFGVREMDLRQLIETRETGKIFRCRFRSELSVDKIGEIGLKGGF